MAASLQRKPAVILRRIGAGIFRAYRGQREPEGADANSGRRGYRGRSLKTGRGTTRVGVPELRADASEDATKLERYSAEGYRLAEQGVLRLIPEKSLPIPPAHFVRVLNALTEGLPFERCQPPREITDDVIRSAFEALASGAQSKGPHGAV